VGEQLKTTLEVTERSGGRIDERPHLRSGARHLKPAGDPALPQAARRPGRALPGRPPRRGPPPGELLFAVRLQGRGDGRRRDPPRRPPRPDRRQVPPRGFPAAAGGQNG
jgi:hypothetical protein